MLTYLISPASETATGPDILGLKLRKQFLEHALTLKGGSWVAMIETAVVSGDNLVCGLNHVGVDEALNRVLEESGLVDWLHSRF